MSEKHLTNQAHENERYEKFSRIRKTFGVWDDHDAGLNDYIGAETDAAEQAARHENFKKFVNAHNSGFDAF